VSIEQQLLPLLEARKRQHCGSAPGVGAPLSKPLPTREIREGLDRDLVAVLEVE
jgi:hypothetical protein